MKKSIPQALLVCLSLAVLAGCGKEVGPVAASPRSVKVERVEAAGAARIETFTGTVRATRRSELGFESGGRIATLLVDVGDTVDAGQLLATIDPVPMQERLRKAVADQGAAAANLAERDAQLRRVRLLQHDEVVADAVLEDALLQRDGAAAQLEAADAGLMLARRDVAMGKIAAPFAGRIVARAAQPSMNMAPGQTVLEIEGSGAREVVVFLPGELAGRLIAGDKATVADTGQIHTDQPQRTTVRLENISGHADNGSLVQAIFRVENEAFDIRPGSAVMLELPGEAVAGMTVPASALLLDAQPGQGAVYVFDTAQRRVTLRKVRIEPGLARDGRLSVAAGLQPGEWVVVAGPAFLSDGQAATAFESQTRLSDPRQ